MGLHPLELVEQIQGIGGNLKRETVRVDGNSLVSRTVKQFRRILPEAIKIRLALSPTEARVAGDPTLLHTVIEKVLMNAMEGIGNNPGLIKIDAAVTKLTGDDHGDLPKLDPGRYYQITVVDDGEGIPKDIQRRVFEPYFTTKSGGIGKGLGLSTARGIVSSHGGGISLASIQGEGTAVQILLPVSEEAAAPVLTSVDRLPRGTERVLIVDDESFVTVTLEKMLTFLGYRVTRVDRSQKALDCFLNEADRPEVVVTDWALPDIPGDALAEMLVSQYPSTRVILISAFSGDFDDAALRARGIQASLAKPVDIQLLATTLRRVLDE